MVPDQVTDSASDVAESAPLVPQPRERARTPGMAVSTIRYLLRTDVHTFAFSVAANSILSFFPFVVLVMTLVRRVFHSRVMYDVLLELLRDYLPAGQEFVIRNLNAMVDTRRRVQVVSLIILLVTSTGVFMPIEVALNRVWRFSKNRSYLENQLISLGLALGCGTLAMLSIAMTAGNVALMEFLLRGHSTGFVRVAGFVVMKVFAVATSIAIFFLAGVSSNSLPTFSMCSLMRAMACLLSSIFLPRPSATPFRVMSSGVGPSPPTTTMKSGRAARSSFRPADISSSESVTVRTLSSIPPIL